MLSKQATESIYESILGLNLDPSNDQQSLPAETA